MPLAIFITLLIGLLGGGLNALMIARLNFPPLIVTLGTFSLFRGIAEGLTRGIENYSGFSPAFLFLGQGYVGGVIPAQLFILIAAIAGFAWWLHRRASAAAFTRSDIPPKGRDMRASLLRDGSALFTCCRGLRRASRQ